MSFRNLFRLPELFLFLPLLFMLYYGNAAIDIHMHDTYFVFEQAGYTALLLIFPLLFTSWIIHVLLRRKSRLPAQWRWTQVVITLLCPLVVGIIANNFPHGGTSRRFYDVSSYSDLLIQYKLMILCLLVFMLSQPVFWITGAVLLIRRPSR